jgi:hypothetical protein
MELTIIRSYSVVEPKRKFIKSLENYGHQEDVAIFMIQYMDAVLEVVSCDNKELLS